MAALTAVLSLPFLLVAGGLLLLPALAVSVVAVLVLPPALPSKGTRSS
jgi:hypothetical protein